MHECREAQGEGEAGYGREAGLGHVRKRPPAASTKHETPPQGGVLGFGTVDGVYRQVHPVLFVGGCVRMRNRFVFYDLQGRTAPRGTDLFGASNEFAKYAK